MLDKICAQTTCCCNAHSTAPHPYVYLSVGLGQDAELQPDFEEVSAEAAWQSVLDTIEQHESSHHKHRLHLAAVQAALAKEHRLKLPPALLAPFQAGLHPQPYPVHQHRHNMVSVLRQQGVTSGLGKYLDIPATHTAAEFNLTCANPVQSIGTPMQCTGLQCMKHEQTSCHTMFWLQASEDLFGMAGKGADPADLLTVYLQHDRLTDAADLVLDHLAAYQKVMHAVPDSLISTKHEITLQALLLAILYHVCTETDCTDHTAGKYHHERGSLLRLVPFWNNHQADGASTKRS